MAKRNGVARLSFPPEWWQESGWQGDVRRATEDLAKPKFVWLQAGRGAGKDIGAIRCALRDALKWHALQKARQRQGKLRLALNPLVKIWVVAPQEDNITQTWEDWKGELTGLANAWGPLCGQEEGSTDWLWWETVREKKITIIGDGEIVIQKRLSSTKGALRGPGVDIVHWTEFAVETSPGEIHRSFKQELPGTMLRAGRLGRMYITTTARGPIGPYWDELVARFAGEGFKDVENGGLWSEDGLNYYHHVDSFQNEFLTPEQVAAMRAESVNGWLYEQERLGKFVIGDLGGRPAFLREWLAKCLVGVRSQDSRVGEEQQQGSPGRHGEHGGKRRGFRRVCIGVDVARLGGDETAYVAVDEDSAELLRVEYWSKLTGERIRDDLIRLHEEFPGCRIKIDSTGHRGYIADFCPSWLPIEETQFSREKEKWVGGLRMLLQMGRLRIPDPEACSGLSDAERAALRKLIKQLLAFQEIVKQSGVITYSHPPGENDDGVDGLLLAVMDIATRLQETLGPRETKRALAKLNI